MGESKTVVFSIMEPAGSATQASEIENGETRLARRISRPTTVFNQRATGLFCCRLLLLSSFLLTTRNLFSPEKNRLMTIHAIHSCSKSTAVH